VSNTGYVVGEGAARGSAPNRAFLRHDGVLRALGTLGGQWSRAWVVNDAGQVVREAKTGDLDEWGFPVVRAFAWEDGVMRDLGTLAGFVSYAEAINEAGQAVGRSELAEPGRYWQIVQDRAFLWQDGVMIDLGTLGGDQSAATDINDLGQVVGWSEVEETDEETGRPLVHPFI